MIEGQVSCYCRLMASIHRSCKLKFSKHHVRMIDVVFIQCNGMTFYLYYLSLRPPLARRFFPINSFLQKQNISNYLCSCVAFKSCVWEPYCCNEVGFFSQVSPDRLILLI